MERQTQLENIIGYYGGEFLSSFIEDGDSFSVTLKIKGAGLRDVVLNYSYIFEVALKSEVKCEVSTSTTQELLDELSIEEPTSDSPIICVIDSGIQEIGRAHV